MCVGEVKMIMPVLTSIVHISCTSKTSLQVPAAPVKWTLVFMAV